MKTLFYQIVAYKCMFRLANHAVAGGKNVWSLLQGFRGLSGVGSEACIDPQCLQGVAAP